MVDVIKMYDDSEGPPPVECRECGEVRFFLFPDNTASCVSCDKEYRVLQLGPMYLLETK